VDHISQLTLLETAQLNELLKSTLNIPDTPMMPVGGFGGAATTQESQASAEAVEEKTEFTVRLVKYTDESKIKLIKEIKTQMEGMSLVQAKKFVEAAPQVVQADVSKEEAERLKAALEAVGGTVEID
jgi:large subunit ribosomal protein L7/L12